MIKYLCVLDFEATCHENVIKPTQEIIEFPSVLYKLSDSKIEFISEFSRYVKPVLENKLSLFCTKLTGISTDKVENAEPIEKVYKDHFEWLTSNTEHNQEVYIVTCGSWDLSVMLPKEISNKKLPIYSVYKRYINIKDEFERFYKKKAGGMVGMLDHLNIKLEGRHHSGIDDTRNISKILVKMIEDGHEDFSINYVKYK